MLQQSFFDDNEPSPGFYVNDEPAPPDLFGDPTPAIVIRKHLREADKVGVGHNHIESLADSLPYDIMIGSRDSGGAWQAHLSYVQEYFERDAGESTIGFDVMRRKGEDHETKTNSS